MPTKTAPDTAPLHHHGAYITDTAYWTEDGTHVFSSDEFDIQGEGASKDEARAQFVENLTARTDLPLLVDRFAEARKNLERQVLLERAWIEDMERLVTEKRVELERHEALLKRD